MKAKYFFTTFLILGFLWAMNSTPSHAQKTAKVLTLLYSNNVNGEIDSCPT